MAVYYRTQGIILGKRDRREADRVFTVFTKDFGKVELHAIAERKITSKLRGGLELFYLSEFEFVQGRAHKTLTDALLGDPYFYMRNDLGKLRIAYRLAEMVEVIVRGEEKDQKIWTLLQDTFCFLNEKELTLQDAKFLSYYFLWNLLSFAGYRPEMEVLKKEAFSVADVIGGFLKGDMNILKQFQQSDVNEKILRQVSRTYLANVLKSW